MATGGVGGDNSGITPQHDIGKEAQFGPQESHESEGHKGATLNDLKNEFVKAAKGDKKAGLKAYHHFMKLFVEQSFRTMQEEQSQAKQIEKDYQQEG